MKSTLVLAVILTAVVDPVLAQVACPNPVPDEPTRAQIVACMRAISALQTQITDANAKIDSLAELPKPTKGDPGPPGPRGEPGLPGLPRTAHRVGPAGNVDPEGDQDLDFTGNLGECKDGVCSKLVEHTEQFAFCGLTTARFTTPRIDGAFICDVTRDRTSGKWKVRFSSSYSICRITCLR
jgi:hypothetical protein